MRLETTGKAVNFLHSHYIVTHINQQRLQSLCEGQWFSTCSASPLCQGNVPRLQMVLGACWVGNVVHAGLLCRNKAIMYTLTMQMVVGDVLCTRAGLVCHCETIFL